jgi:hypothetical protein
MNKLKYKKKYDFILETDWVFQGYMDAEHRRYVLLDYFTKMGGYLEEIKLYPMFLELSIHLGNIHTLIKDRKILYVDKVIPTPDYELLPTDLKMKDMPLISEEEESELQKILKESEILLKDYFNFAKSLWTLVYDSIDISVKHNKDNIKSKTGFFYYKKDEYVYVWKYTNRKVYKVKNQTRTSMKLIYEGNTDNLDIKKIITKFSKTYETKEESKLPIFKMVSDGNYPINETLGPLFKRKLVALIS